MSKEIIVLGIETSCDESALALVRVHKDGRNEVIGEVLASQIALHQQYGGVVPELAAREHLKALPILYKKLCETYPQEVNDATCIAVTQGPGLKGCLLIGINFAKGLSFATGKPLIGVNHIEGHLYSSFLNKTLPNFDFISLIVSGGHTELVHVKPNGIYSVIARTIDDAAGEAFDKSAHLLGFPYPGGKALSEVAASVSSSPFILPKVMREADGFSFSGLKTAIHLLIKKNGAESASHKAELCYSIEHAIVDALMHKLKKSLDLYSTCNVISVVGGVSANRLLRDSVTDLCSKRNISLFLPEPQFATDNASMIALAGGFRWLDTNFSLVKSSLGLGVYARYPIESIQ